VLANQYRKGAGMSGWTEFVNGVEPHALDNGLYEAEVEEGERIRDVGRARLRRGDFGWTHESGMPLTSWQRIVRVKRLANPDRVGGLNLTPEEWAQLDEEAQITAALGSGLVRKVAYLPAELEAELRDAAHRLQRS
jgi:hypothetical protein